MHTVEEIEKMMSEIGYFSDENLKRLDQLTSLDKEWQKEKQKLRFIQVAAINSEEEDFENVELARNSLRNTENR